MNIPKDPRTHVALLKIDGEVVARIEAEFFAVMFVDGKFNVHAYSGDDDSLYFVDAVLME